MGIRDKCSLVPFKVVNTVDYIIIASPISLICYTSSRRTQLIRFFPLVRLQSNVNKMIDSAGFIYANRNLKCRAYCGNDNDNLTPRPPHTHTSHGGIE